MEDAVSFSSLTPLPFFSHYARIVREMPFPDFVREQEEVERDPDLQEILKRINLQVGQHEKHTIFISHAWQKSLTENIKFDLHELWIDGFAELLSKHLKLLGFEIILDKTNLGWGKQLASAMEESTLGHKPTPLFYDSEKKLSITPRHHVQPLLTKTYFYQLTNKTQSGCEIEFDCIVKAINDLGKQNVDRFLLPLACVDQIPLGYSIFDSSLGFASEGIKKAGYWNVLLEYPSKLLGIEVSAWKNYPLLRKCSPHSTLYIHLNSPSAFFGKRQLFRKNNMGALEALMVKYADENRGQGERIKFLDWLQQQANGNLHVENGQIKGQNFNLEGSFEEYADLSKSILDQCNLSNGRFKHACFKKVNFQGCILEKADLSFVKNLDATALAEAEFTDLLIDPADTHNVSIRKAALDLKKRDKKIQELTLEREQMRQLIAQTSKQQLELLQSPGPTLGSE